MHHSVTLNQNTETLETGAILHSIYFQYVGVANGTSKTWVVKFWPDLEISKLEVSSIAKI